MADDLKQKTPTEGRFYQGLVLTHTSDIIRDDFRAELFDEWFLSYKRNNSLVACGYFANRTISGCAVVAKEWW